jgi:hypothetical protein
MLARSQYSSKTTCERPTISGFPSFFSVLEQMLSWCPKSMLHCYLLMRPSHHQLQTSAKMQPSERFQNVVMMQSSKHRVLLICSTCCLCCMLQQDISQRSTLPSAYLTRRTRANNLRPFKAINFCSPLPPAPRNNPCSALNTPPRFPFWLFFRLQRVNYDFHIRRLKALYQYSCVIMYDACRLSSHLFTQVTALCSKLCHLKYEHTA